MPFVAALLFIFNSLISLAIFLVIVTAVLSWLVAFDVINLAQPDHVSDREDAGRAERADAAPDPSVASET